MSKARKIENQTVVIVYEQALEMPEMDASEIREAIRDALSTLQMYGSGRVVNHYTFTGTVYENKEWLQKGLTEIEVPIMQPTVKIDIDV